MHQQRRNELNAKVLKQEEKIKSLESHIRKQKEGITSALNLFGPSAMHTDRTNPSTLHDFKTTLAKAKPKDLKPILSRKTTDVEMAASQALFQGGHHAFPERERNSEFENIDSEIASLNVEIKTTKATYP